MVTVKAAAISTHAPAMFNGSMGSTDRVVRRLRQRSRHKARGTGREQGRGRRGRDGQAVPPVVDKVPCHLAEVLHGLVVLEDRGGDGLQHEADVVVGVGDVELEVERHQQNLLRFHNPLHLRNQKFLDSRGGQMP